VEFIFFIGFSYVFFFDWVVLVFISHSA